MNYADATRTETLAAAVVTNSVVFACSCFSLARTGKNAANGVGVGIAELFIVGIAELFIDRSRFAACLAGIMMSRCSGHVD